MKTFKTFVILATFFITSFSYARKTDDAVEIQNDGKQIVLIVKKGFHFNAEAPASASFDQHAAHFQPTVKTEPKIVFDVPPQATKGTLSYFVCDDAKTVCEKHTKNLEVNKTVKAEATRTSAAEPERTSKMLADKPALLIFSAPWCPACIRMKTETYTKSSVKSLMAKLRVQTINIDLVENEELSKIYGVKAIPTLILLNRAGQEVYRWLDYQPAASFAKSLKSEMENSQALSQLEDKAQAGDVAAATKLGMNAYNKMQWEKAAKWLALSKDEAVKKFKLAAEISLAADAREADDKKAPDYTAALEKGFSLTTSRFDRVRWKLDYLEAIKEQKRPIDTAVLPELHKELVAIKDAKDIAKIYNDGTYGDMSGFEKAETLDMLIRLSDLSDDGGGKKQAQAELSDLLTKTKYSVNEPGQVILAAYYLGQAGKLQEAEAWNKKLIAKYDKTYVYYDRYARFLLKHKRYAEALPQIDLALKFKEGNEPQLNTTKVKILIGLDQKAEAIKLTDDTLEIIAPYPEKYKRTKSALIGLKEQLVKK